MNQDAFNMSIRKFLKHVGVHSQREIESAVQARHVRRQAQGQREAAREDDADASGRSGWNVHLRGRHRARVVDDAAQPRAGHLRRHRGAAARLEGVAHRTPVATSAPVRRAHRRAGVLQVREPAAHGRVQVPRRLQRAFACSMPSARARRGRVLLGQPCAGRRARRARCSAFRATIVMPADAPAVKVAATRGYGARSRALRPRRGREPRGCRRAHRGREGRHRDPAVRPSRT